MLNDTAARSGNELEGLNLVEVMGKCLPAAVVVSSPDETLSTLNPAAERLLGISSPAVMNRSLDVLPLPLRQVIQRTVQEQASQTVEIAFPAEGGGQRPIHVSTSMVPAGERF